MAKPTTDKVQIPNSTLWMKQKVVDQVRHILIYGKASDDFPMAAVEGDRTDPKISFRNGNYATPEEARLMAKALEQTAAIASDFETWWGEQ